MVYKYPICPDRIRIIPEQFSWLDHRLVRERHIEHLTHEAAALYLFLVTVADSQGLSYYADHSIAQRLAMAEGALAEARNCLLTAGLIAYKAPLYQVLELESLSPRSLHPKRDGENSDSSPRSLAAIFRQMAGGAP
jgi:hypothetical protein